LLNPIKAPPGGEGRGWTIHISHLQEYVKALTEEGLPWGRTRRGLTKLTNEGEWGKSDGKIHPHHAKEDRGGVEASALARESRGNGKQGLTFSPERAYFGPESG